MNTKIIAVSNQKGGVGKTTTTLNIGTGLALLNKKILLIDLDLQGSLSKSVGIPEPIHTIYEVLKGSIKAKEAIYKHKGYDVITADNRLSNIELEISQLVGREYILKEALQGIINDYDFIFIDTPPALNLITVNALTFANYIYIPVSLNFLALQGLKELLHIYDVVKQRLNPDIEIGGIIATFFDKRKIINKEVLTLLKSKFKNKVFDTVISDNVSLAEAPSYAKNIFQYKPKSKGAVDYLKLCNEIIKRG